MNSTMKLLYAQALKEESGEGEEAVATRFGELIVLECINTVNKRYMGDNNREDMEVRRCVTELKNRFGVE